MIDPRRALLWRFRPSTAISVVLLILYLGLTFYLFFSWVNPSLDGRTDLHIAADSSVYIYFGRVLSGEVFDPSAFPVLFTFPNTLLGPATIALLFGDTVAIVAFNYALLLVALFLLKRAFKFSAHTFLWLMLINATTTISLISVNKEIIDFFVMVLFLFGVRRRHPVLVAIALTLAVFNRFEVAIVLCLYLCLTSRFNPLRHRRALMLVGLTLGMTISLPLFASKTLSERLVEASQGHTVALLDFLEVHYLYALVVVPKIAENLFAEIVNFQKAGAYLEFSDIANTYIVFFNNLASAIVIGMLIRKRAFSIQNDLIYLAVIGWVIMAVALVIQPRYFYSSYVLLCLCLAENQALVPTRNRDRTNPLTAGGLRSCDSM